VRRRIGSAVTVDLDSSILETYGLQKQGGSGFTHTHVRGYHPLFAVVAGGGEVLHCRLREGRANSGRGADSFARQALARLRRAGTCGEVVVRADSGFYSQKVVRGCQAHDARFSISVRLQRRHHELIAEIPEGHWEPIPYWLEGAADVAEIAYAPFGGKQTYRLVVRRVAASSGCKVWPTATSPSSPTARASCWRSKPTTGVMPRSKTPSAS
jgi:DDE family transposase